MAFLPGRLAPALGLGAVGLGPPSREEELRLLESQARALEAQLKAIKERLEELTKEEK